MRRVLTILTLVLCLCGCAYAKDNPYRAALARLDGGSGEAAAEYLVRFSQEGGGLELVQKDDGFGGYIVFTPETEPEGLYSVTNISEYEKDLYEAEKEYLSESRRTLKGLFMIFLLMFVVSGGAILYLGKHNLKPALLNKNSEMLIIVLGAVMTLMWICICGVTVSYVSYMYCSRSSEEGKYSPLAYQTVLQEYVRSEKAEFYPREDIGKLLGKYAAMYDGQTR